MTSRPAQTEKDPVTGPDAPEPDRLSLYPLTFEEALAGLLAVDPRKTEPEPDQEDKHGDRS